MSDFLPETCFLWNLFGGNATTSSTDVCSSTQNQSEELQIAPVWYVLNNQVIPCSEEEARFPGFFEVKVQHQQVSNCSKKKRWRWAENDETETVGALLTFYILPKYPKKNKS